MQVRELKNDEIVMQWLRSKQPNTHKTYLLAMQHYTEYTGKTPVTLLEEAKADIRAGKLMDERGIFDMLGGYRNYLENRELAPLSIIHYLAAVKSFYRYRNIDVPILQDKIKAVKLKQNKKVPDKEAIQQALSVCGVREKAIALSGLSSGMGAAEISTLTLKAFQDGYDPETEITTLDMRRVKVQRDYIAFLSPEASRAVLAYLELRDRPTRTGRQVDKDIQAKQKTTPDSYLFITEHVPIEYLKESDPKRPAESDSEYRKRKAKAKKEGVECEPQRKAETEHDYKARLEKEKLAREELRRLTPDAILKVYRKISDRAGMDSAPGVYNLIRSHNMRKWFNSTLKREGCDSDIVEFFMGHTLGATKDAYLDLEIDGGVEKLKSIYASFVPYLTIQKELDVATSDEYKKIEEENRVLRAETARHVVERSEMADMKKQLQELQLAMGILQVMSAADENGLMDRAIEDEPDAKARRELKADKARRARLMNSHIEDSAIEEANREVGMTSDELAEYKKKLADEATPENKKEAKPSRKQYHAHR